MAKAENKENWFKRVWANIKRLCREMRSELKKVVWPSRKQMINNTLIVIACVLVVGICVWVFDAVGSLFVQGLIGVVKG